MALASDLILSLTQHDDSAYAEAGARLLASFFHDVRRDLRTVAEYIIAMVKANGG